MNAPQPSTSCPLEATRKLAPLIRENANEIEKTRELPRPVFEAIADAGLFLLCVPKALGGGEIDFPTQVRIAEVLGLADAIGFERFVILGHSMGGMITQCLVLRAPDRIEALVLMDTSHGPLPIDPELVKLGVTVAREEGIDVVADIMGAASDGPLATEVNRRMMAEDPSYAARGDRNLRASSPAMFAAMLATFPVQPDRLAALATLSMPVLVIVGDQDAPFIRDSERMAATIPGADLAVIPGGGHSPQLEAPAAWWEALSGFLASLPAS